MAVNNLIKLRRGSATDWSSNPTLSQGEPGLDTTNNILKIGDGSTAWNLLPVINNNTYITSLEDDGSPVLGGSLTLDQHSVVVEVRNDSGSGISAGTPVYISGYHSGSSKPLIAPANASSVSTMPAFGIVENTIADGAEGLVAVMGIVSGLDTTSPISFTIGDIAYVKSGGGLTNVKPNGASESIQNLGKVTRVDASNGRILLLGAGRSNDIPNSGTFNGNVQAASFIKSGGTSSEFLKADGSVDTSTYLTAHPSISAASSSDNSGRTYIQDIGLDSNGHVTSITTATETVTDTNTQLTEEQVQDFVGGMLTGNTETGITVTYQDDDGTIDFVVASQTDENFTTADHSKLDGIEASADVTDTENVTSAGALMDSEVTNLAQVKAFDSSDYATAAQGTKADSAQQPPAEGAFVDGDKTKLDGIEASADVTDATNVDAAGAVMNSDSSTASMSFVIDEDNMSSNSATKVPTQQSVKAYVDANSGGGGGGGSMTTVKAGGSQVGGADIVTLDFATDFTIGETPDTEINISIADGAISSSKMTTSTLVLNEAGAAVDFRVEGDTDTHLLFVDGSADKVGIGTDSPSYTLHVDGNIGLTSEGFYASPTGVMIGVNSWLYNDGQTAFAHGRFSENGDAQNSCYILRCSTTNATFTTAQNNGTNIVLASNRTMMFTANIVGRRTDQVNASNSDNAAYVLRGCLHNDGYGAALVGSVSKTVIAETDSSWDVRATVTGAGAGGTDNLNIQVKGASSKNVNWVVKLDLLEVGGDVTGYTEANPLGLDASNMIP